MCGIAGIVGPQDCSDLERMCGLLSHRGPDGEGVFRHASGRVALGHRRLSIIDLEGGVQPMANEDGSLHIVFNGEIFNAPELRCELEAKGHRFSTRNSDTEVLLHLYEEKSSGMLGSLSGMFAFAIHDAARNVLFCARDRLGIKPFYYTCKNGRFAFASELRALAGLPFVSREVNPQSLYHYVGFQFVPAPDSILGDVKKLPAAHCLTLDANTFDQRVERYWDLRFSPDRSRDVRDWPGILRENMLAAVKRWSLSDVPVACSLSGGLDSSVVTGMLAQSGIGQINTYSLGFSGQEASLYGEIDLARLTAAKWGTKHHEIILEPEQVLADLPRMVRSLDEPYGGGLPSWYVFRSIGGEFKVAMTGTGGDELFGNYGKWTIFESGPLGRWLAALSMQGAFALSGRFKDAWRFPRGHFYHRYFSDAAKRAVVFRPEIVRAAKESSEGLIEARFNGAASASPRDATAFVDIAMQLPEEFLLMTDRFSMAHGVEARVPLLDHALMELVFTVPAEIRTRQDDFKCLMREVAEPYLPEELLRAPKKGFVLPLREWTRGKLRPVVEEFLTPDALNRQGIFSSKVWSRVVRPHLTGQADHTARVWTLLMFQLWHDSRGEVHAV